MIHEVSMLSARGQVTIPKPVREAIGVDAGAQLSFEVIDDRRVVLMATESAVAENRAASRVGQLDDDEPYDPP